MEEPPKTEMDVLGLERGCAWLAWERQACVDASGLDAGTQNNQPFKKEKKKDVHHLLIGWSILLRFFTSGPNSNNFGRDIRFYKQA
jgi:hypothetical protein